MKFKEWVIREMAVDREKQIDKAGVTAVKPTYRDTQLGRYLYMKRQKKS